MEHERKPDTKTSKGLRELRGDLVEADLAFRRDDVLEIVGVSLVRLAQPLSSLLDVLGAQAAIGLQGALNRSDVVLAGQMRLLVALAVFGQSDVGETVTEALGGVAKRLRVIGL